MNSNKKIARIVGVLFIIATVATILSLAITGPILDDPDYLINISANENQMITGMLFMLFDAVSVAGIAIMMYPILKKQNEASALGYVGARIVESVLFIVYVIILLTLLTLSQEFVKAGSPDASYFQTEGTLLLAASDWTFSIGLGLVFALSALILNYSLYQSRLVPRWLSGWGFVGAALVLALTLLAFFSINLTEILNLPIALQEMVFAVWLIVKGFNSSAIASGSAETI
ncbi:MAG: DUF4386 domain-containing protein [Chloroflexi bacterium]|nr:DUF4386 domain-containing protein [Chloroflexota bacterium]